MRRARLLAIIVSAAFSVDAAAQVRIETVVRGLRNPVAAVADPLDRAVLLIVEQGGLVRIARDGVLLPEPFLDLRSSISSGGERGLLGFAFAPDTTESRRFFVNFTNTAGHTVVARFVRSAERPLTVDLSSRFDLVWPDGRRFISQPFSNHNGGHLAFGPDGYLYIGLGDGGSGGDPQNHAQNPDSLLGKMLRLDVNVPDDDPRGYRIPEDNPFLDGDPVRAMPEIWAFGLRNPWRYSFDDWTRGGTGALLIADVGQSAREEINFEPRGKGGRNYGWRLREGRQPYDTRTPAAFLPLSEPLHDYSRSVGQSITGGYVYRGAALDPSWNGRYFYADFVAGRVFSIGLHLDPLTSEASADDEREHTEAFGGRATLGMISSFASDHDGELLVVNYAGTVLRLVPDFTLVPRAPVVNAAWNGNEFELDWTPAADGVTPLSYWLETVGTDGVVTRIDHGAHTSARVALSPAACVRVRAQGRDGAGPPAGPFCAPPAPPPPLDPARKP